ncbi:MAG: hypothetical protein WBC44_11720 [Planctomycetaceae bacterium]
MHPLLLVAALAATPTSTFSSPGCAAAALSGQVATGSLLVSEGDCLAVKVFTGSPYTHVAGVVVEEGRAFVYDSQNGVGVRKQTLENYLASIRPDELRLLNPTEAFDEDQAQEFRGHLEGELGRPYAVRHHLTGERCDGVHCAEYVTDALMAADLVKAKQPPRVSPASLRAGLLRHHLYDESQSITIAESELERAAGDNWCEEIWLDTKDCCASCWSGFRRCVLCR